MIQITIILQTKHTKSLQKLTCCLELLIFLYYTTLLTLYKLIRHEIICY